jgi:hypothetical protein
MMRTLILISSLALAACNMAADAQQPAGGGERGQRSYNLTGFDKVALAGPHDVVVTVGPAHSVRAEGDRDSLDKLDIRVENGSLKVGMKKGMNSFSWGNRTPKTTIFVSLPAIRSAAIAGSGDMKVDRVEGNSFAGSIAGSGDLQVAALRTGEAEFSIAGSGNISAAGNAKNTDVSVAGSGNVDLERLEARTASVSIVGSGDVRAKAMETANVSIMGSGDVTMSGSARCNVNKRGSGSVRCGNA